MTVSAGRRKCWPHNLRQPSGKKYALHLVPSGILSKSCAVRGGQRCCHSPADSLFEEIETLEAQGVSTERLIISERAHLLFDLHKVWQRPTFSAVIRLGADQHTPVSLLSRKAVQEFEHLRRSLSSEL